MGSQVITVRGRTFSVESKSGSQLAFIVRSLKLLSDEQLDSYEREYREGIPYEPIKET